MTLDEIAERLAINKTTVWYWIKDLPLAPPGKALQTPKRRAARLAATRANSDRAAQLRTHAYEQGRREFEDLCRIPTFRDFVCIYIGEGTRSNRNAVAVANSNPAVIRLANRWISRFAKNPVKYWCQHHADQDPEVLKRSWADQLGIDASVISCWPKSNSGKLVGRNSRSLLAVLTVRVGDTQLRARIQAWMDCVQEEWA